MPLKITTGAIIGIMITTPSAVLLREDPVTAAEVNMATALSAGEISNSFSMLAMLPSSDIENRTVPVAVANSA